MDLIQLVLEGTKEAEAPQAYFYWAILCAISAVVKNNVWLDRFLFKQFKLFPNIYVILVGKSGMKKGVPIWLAQTLVEGVDNTRVIAGRTTIPGILSDLAKIYTREDAEPIKDASAFLVASEFAAFMIENPVEALTVLTTLYDSQYIANWKYNLKSEPLTLKGVCLTMFAASNQTHLKDAMPANAHSGGFLARTFLIVENRKNKSNPLTRASKKELDLHPIVEELKRKSKLKGAFSYTTDSMALYEDWYEKNDERQMKDDTGTENRLGDSILKTAMLISLARSDELIITETDMEDAISSCAGFIRAAHQTTMGMGGKSEIAPLTAIVLLALYEFDKKGIRVSRKKLLRKMWEEGIDVPTLDRITDTMCQAGIIKDEQAGAEIMLSLTNKGKSIVENTLVDEED